MERLNNYLFLFLNYLEEGRLKIFSVSSHALKNSGILISDKNSFEDKLRNYNPLTIILGFFLIFCVFKFLLNKLVALWNAFSKYSKFTTFRFF
jgi:hypothetical protein